MPQALKVETFPIGSYSCNCSLIYSPDTREAIAIDCGNDAEAFLAKVKSLDLTVKVLLHTHAHFDHIGHADTVRKATGAPIALHKGDQFLYDALPQQAAFFRQTVGQPGKIDCYLEDGAQFGIHVLTPDMQSPALVEFLQVIHTPGHTPGSVSFYTEALGEPLLFSGDTLFARSIGRTDLPGGDSGLIIRSIKQRLLVLPDETRCITGHGTATTIYSEKRSNPFLC
jgi:hydroxyacylglutathione hydrolase